MKDKYNACILLHALGDTIGFKNGDWEFNHSINKSDNEIINNNNFNPEYTLEILYEFISLGGAANINLNGWFVSDDTLLHMCVIKTLLKEHKNIETICKILRKYFIKAIDESYKSKIKRYYGITTKENINKLSSSELNWNKLKYNDRYDGSGASMKSLCLGLVYYGEKNRNELIEKTIETCRMTHNSVEGYIGALAASIFIAYAIEKIDIYEWSLKFVKLLESDIIDLYLKNTRGYNEYINNKHYMIAFWTEYNDYKFDKEGIVIKKKNDKHLIARNKRFCNLNFSKIPNKNNVSGYSFGEGFWIGSTSCSAVLYAYDCLLDCDSVFDTLICYSMLHWGDSDTTGCIAAGFYGAVYGFKNIHENLLKNIEFKEELLDLSNKLYKKFYKK
jgi:ADP-ribosylarginine hydrolase